MESIEVLIVEGAQERIPNEVWVNKGVKVVVLVTQARVSGRKRRKRRRVLEKGWECKKIHFINHNEAGSVTNGSFRVEILGRMGVVADWSLPQSVSAKLGNVLDPTVSVGPGEMETPFPQEGEMATYLGLLDWDHRHEEIIAPSVFFEGASKRMMNAKE